MLAGLETELWVSPPASVQSWGECLPWTAAAPTKPTPPLSSFQSQQASDFSKCFSFWSLHHDLSPTSQLEENAILNCRKLCLSFPSDLTFFGKCYTLYCFIPLLIILKNYYSQKVYESFQHILEQSLPRDSWVFFVLFFFVFLKRRKKSRLLFGCSLEEYVYTSRIFESSSLAASCDVADWVQILT